MQENQLISIALCTYNGQEHLHEQLESVINQTHRPIEIIVSDDASTDLTLQILNNYQRHYDFIKVYQNPTNIGFNKNFEKALGYCNSELIAICDQDDIWLPEKLQLQLEALSDHQLVYHDSEFVNHQGLSLGISMSDKFNLYKGGDPQVFLFNNCVSGHSVLFRKSLLKQALPFPKEFYYDQWIAFIATSNGTIEALPQRLVKYRQHQNNATDILAKRKTPKSSLLKIKGLIAESKWLQYCSAITSKKENKIAKVLHQLSLKRNRSWGSLKLVYVIWQNRNSLLFLLKKDATSKFFYALRKCWGAKTKALF